MKSTTGYRHCCKIREGIPASTTNTTSPTLMCARLQVCETFSASCTSGETTTGPCTSQGSRPFPICRRPPPGGAPPPGTARAWAKAPAAQTAPVAGAKTSARRDWALGLPELPITQASGQTAGTRTACNTRTGGGRLGQRPIEGFREWSPTEGPGAARRSPSRAACEADQSRATLCGINQARKPDHSRRSHWHAPMGEGINPRSTHARMARNP